MNYAYAMGQAPTGAPGQQTNPIVSLIPIFLIFIIFYFMLIMPQRKRQKEHEKMLSAIKRSDRVVTTGGIHGTVLNVEETAVILEVDDNTKIKVQKNCIGHIKKQG
ncbi:MAG: preprotein translocase subunit YajC [Candidatus Omnitrophota bacterium]